LGKLPPGLIQHPQPSKPSELTIYGNAITRVLLAVVNEALLQATASGLTSDIFVDLNLNWPLRLATGIRIAPRCCRWRNAHIRLTRREPDNPDRTQPTDP
jgi:hypothetical protein